MIIDKVAPFWADEDRERINELNENYFSIHDALKEEGYDENLAQKMEEQSKLLIETEVKAREDAQKRYIQHFSDDPSMIYSDIEEIIHSITQKDFQAMVRHNITFLSWVEGISPPLDESTLSRFRKSATEDFENCLDYCSDFLDPQIEALQYYDLDTRRVLDIITNHISQWYEVPERYKRKTHLPIPWSKPTNAIAYANRKNVRVTKGSPAATIESYDVTIRVDDWKKKKASLRPSTHKLLSAALIIFGENNDFHKGTKIAQNREVSFSLRDYAAAQGYDIEPHHTNTPEKEATEKKRAKNTLDNARKKVKEDMDTLYRLSFDWQEINNKGEIENFRSVRLLSAMEYKRGNITISFTPEIANYLAQRGLMTQYNAKLLGIDERRPNAYRIMVKLEEHFNMDVNAAQNRNDIISIEKLLAVTELPSFEEVQEKDRGHWVERIKDPFEENLSYLTSEHFLDDWEYTHAKKVPLSEEEAMNITSYDDFAKLYLHFTPSQTPDQTERREKRKEEQAERKKNRKAKQSKKNKKRQ